MSDHIIDPSFENFVRNALEESVSGATPAPLPNSVRRRARVRQMVTATAAGIGATALIVAAFSFAGSIFGTEPKVDVNGRQMDARGAGGASPCRTDPFLPGLRSFGVEPPPIHCISEGSYQGVSWALGASVDGDNLCIVKFTLGGGAGASTGTSCDRFEPGAIGLNVSQIEGYPKMAAGQVPGDTDTLFLEHGGDERFELQVYRAPEGFPLDLGFYLVFMPDDAQTLVAYDASGEEIARRNIDGPPGAPGEQTERTRNVNIDKGTYDGDISWVLDTFGTVIDGRETVCTALAITDEPAEGIEGKPEDETCHIGVPDHDVIGIAKTITEEVPNVVAYSGVMSSRVDSVILRTNGRELEAEVIAAPNNIEQRLAYFVLIVKGVGVEGLEGTMIARSEGGAILAERDV